MARIQTYINDNNVTLDDKVIGTDAVDNSTKNFTVGDMLDLTTSILVAGTGIDITGNTISCTVVDTNDVDFISNVALIGTDLQFAGVGQGFSGTIDLSSLATASFTAGVGIDITNGVISSTVTDTNTTYDYGAVGAAGNIYIALTGSNATNDVVAVQAGANITLTDNGSNTFTIDAAGGANSFVSGVALNGTTLEFTSSTGAFNGNVPLAGIADQTVQITGANGITVTGTYPVFTVDGAGASGGGTTYTAGTGISIVNNVISSTVTDTNTTYDFGAVGAAGNISFAVTGSDSTNDLVVMQAGANITLTDNGSNVFTIDTKASGATTLSGLTDTTITTPVNNDVLTYNGSVWVNTPPATPKKAERLVMNIATDEATLNESELIMESVGSSVKNNTVHYNANDLVLNLPSFEIANDCTMRIALASYLGSGGQSGNVIFRIYEFSTGVAVLVGEAAFVLSNATSAYQPKTFFSYFEGITGQSFKITVEAQQHTATIGPGSYIEVEIID